MKRGLWLRPGLPLALGLALAVGVLMTVGSWAGVWARAGAATVRYVAPGGACGSATPCYSSVQAAVNAASSGDEIRIATGTYNENVTLNNKTLTLRGGYTTTDWTASNPISYPTVLNGGGAGRVIFVNGNNITVTIENLEITGGRGGIKITNEFEHFVNVNAIIRNNYIHDNDASPDCSYSLHGEGGGIYAKVNAGYTIRIEDNRIVGNTSGDCRGGGVFVYGPDAILSGNVITGNTARRDGMGAYVSSNASCTVTDNTVAQNTGGGHGQSGGLYVECSSITVTGNRVWGNHVEASTDIDPYTAGGLVARGSGLVADNVITGNSVTCYYCTTQAGGLFVEGGVTVRGNVITGNTLASTHGWPGDDDALGIFALGNIVLENNLVADNQAAQGLPFTPEAVMLSTSGNSNCGTSDAYTYHFVHNTVARNGNVTGIKVPAPGNARCPATAYITNTIVYSHAVGVEAVSNSAASVAYSILSNTTNINGNVTTGVGVVYAEPLFLSDGYHIAPNSPARNGGSGSGFAYTDIDGEKRLMGPFTDIGVDEIPYTASVTLSKTRQGSGTAQAGQPISYVLAVSSAATSTWRADVQVVDMITSPYPLAGLQGIGGNASVACQAGSSVITCTYQNVPTDTAYAATVVVTPAVPTQPTAQGFASADNLNIAIPDDGCNSQNYATHTIAVNTPGTILDVDVFIKNITHPYDGDLGISIKGPDGTPVTLSRSNGGNGDNYINTVFDDEASTYIADGTPPFTGRFRPEGRLSDFDGKEAQGNWTLRVCDAAQYDTGTLNGWGLTLTVRMEVTQTLTWVITDTASLTVLDAIDLITTDNTAGPVTTTVIYTPPTPDLWVDKSAPRFAKPNQTITYTLQWGNRGGAAAENVVLTDVLPAQVNFIAAEGNPTRNGRYLTWTLGTVNGGVGQTYLITVSTLTGLQDGTIITNTADIATTSSGDPVLNNTAVATTTIYQLGGVSLQLSKSALATEVTPYFGQVLPNEIVYEITAYNDGQVDAVTTIVDPIPQGTQYVAGSAQIVEGGGSIQYDAVDDEVVWSGNIPVGQSVKIRFTALVVSCDGVQCGLIRNTATAMVNGVSYEWTAQADVTVRCPDLYVSADVPENVFFKPVGYNEYEVVVNYGNRGDHKAPGVEIEAVLQNTDAHFASANPLPAEKKSAQDWVWRPGDLDVNDTGSFRILIYADKWNNKGYPIYFNIRTQSKWYECVNKQSDNEYEDTTYPAKATLDKKGRIRFNPNGKNGPEMWVEYTLYSRYQNAHPNRPPISDMRFRDQWPSEFEFLKAEFNWGRQPTYAIVEQPPAGLHGAAGITSTEHAWSNPYAIVEGTQVYGRLSGRAAAYSLEPGKTITNVAKLTATVQSGHEVFGVITERPATSTLQVPLLPPRIIFPQSGQFCHDDPIGARVMAQPGVSVTLYAGISGDPTYARSLGELEEWTGHGGMYVDFVTLEPGENYIFAVASKGGQNRKSGRVYLDRNNVYWNPQTSFWEGVVKAGPLKGQKMKFQFKDQNGRYSTFNWQMPGVYGFWDTDVVVYPCSNVCPAGQRHEIVIEADGKEYTGTFAPYGGYYEFHITGGAHVVKIKSRCVDENTGQVMSEQVNSGQILIDPDGFVFNVDRGASYDVNTGMFTPVEAVPNVTVTAYVSVPEWGGWVPWPAYLYGQTNPQNTNATYSDGITTTGYFAFFTPPGYYYLEVEGIPGYQRWRSPVIQVITQIVHMNVPYTPMPDTAAVTVTLTPDGPQPAVVTVPMGSAVQWISLVRPTDTITDVVAWMDNPILRPLSALNPLQTPLGFDGGYLEPGRGYRRLFREPGVYTYSDGAGHTGTVVVTGYRIYLPLVMRQHTVSTTPQGERLPRRMPAAVERRWWWFLLGLVSVPWLTRRRRV